MSDVPAIQAIRTPDGRFVKGHGAPGPGRTPLPEAFRAKGPELMRRMVELAEDPDAEHHFDALKWCCERIYGKAAQVVETDGAGGPEVEPVVAVLLARSSRGAEWERVLEGELADKSED